MTKRREKKSERVYLALTSENVQMSGYFIVYVGAPGEPKSDVEHVAERQLGRGAFGIRRDTWLGNLRTMTWAQAMKRMGDNNFYQALDDYEYQEEHRNR